MEFKSWQDIRDWCDAHGYKNIVNRMNLNHDCWDSSGEFGRNQVAICDELRFADDLEATAEKIEERLSRDELLRVMGLVKELK